jgi:hypothetical protein
MHCIASFQLDRWRLKIRLGSNSALAIFAISLSLTDRWSWRLVKRPRFNLAELVDSPAQFGHIDSKNRISLQEVAGQRGMIL